MGLARGVMTAAMNRLVELGHERAMLVTQARREVAIRTYLRFGFRVTDPVMRAYLHGKMGHPAMEE
jgi:ribosomal protein S18 acetylase RimI-like enzyme